VTFSTADDPIGYLPSTQASVIAASTLITSVEDRAGAVCPDAGVGKGTQARQPRIHPATPLAMSSAAPNPAGPGSPASAVARSAS
jgi:hypothetical protein